MKRGRSIAAGAVVVAIALAVTIARAFPLALPETRSPVPVAKVVKTPLKLTVFATGELRAGRTMTLVAPPAGGNLRIVKLLQTGTTVKAGDVIFEFDPADQQYQVEQAKSDLAEADQQIVKMKADAAVRASQDKVDLLTARYNVRRSELAVAANEFIGAIEAQKNGLNLEEAKRRLEQLERDSASRVATDAAALAVLEEKKNKATLAMQRAQSIIDSLVVTSPIDGVVAVKENRDASGGFFFSGMVLPEFRAGDTTFSGRPIADVVESGRMEVRAKVNETDRDNLQTGQAATVQVDSLPGRVFTAKVGALSTLASRGAFFETTAVRQFDVAFPLEQPDPMMRAGSSVRVVIDGRELKDSLHVPRQAVFEKNGKSFVYFQKGERFETHDIKVVNRTESRAVVEGLSEGDVIALVDPDIALRRAKSGGNAVMPPIEIAAPHAIPIMNARTHLWSTDFLPELRLGLENLRAHKMRSALTMLGMIFGVAAVVAMLSIGAGAQQEVMSFIEQLGVRNLIIEAREAPDNQALQKVRKLSPGLSFQDVRIIQANLDGIAASSPRKRFTPSKLLPRPIGGDAPMVYGVTPAYQQIGNLQLASGRFFDDAETTAAAPVAVIGEAAAATLFGTDDPVGRYVKVNEQWFRIIGVAGPQLTVQSDVAGIPAQDRNNLIYVPLYASVFRLEDGQSAQKDEIDGIYLQMQPAIDIPSAAALVRGVLDVAHRGAGDFTIVSPAELLAEQRRTQRIFEMVMVAMASISLLVGGIGIMNIMLASVLERTREIGVRRAIGARQKDVVRQFLIETTIISLTGGFMGIVLGVGLSQLIGILAGWSTIVTTTSIVLAFGVSVAIGIVFGLYPAVRASRLDPVKALHYE